MKIMLLAACIAILSGCTTSRVSFTPPSSSIKPGENVKIIDKSREEVWAKAVPELSKQFFVINNMDRDSGLINLSYSGSPLQYVDCGRITVTMPTLVNNDDQVFLGAMENVNYRVKEPLRALEIQRKLSLDGRINLIFEKVSDSKTRVTVNTRYLLNRQISTNVIGGGFAGNISDSTSFNTGSSGQFPSGDNGQQTSCTSNGNLEKDILSAIN